VRLARVRAIVTGASSGIGVETARSLARAGAEFTLAVRNTDAGTRTAENITQATGNGNLHVSALDLADRASVATFTDRWTGPLHLLINNAGVVVSDLKRTPQGWELQFATTLVAAVAPEFAHTGGHYLDDGGEAHTVGNDADLFENSHGVKEWVLVPDAAQKLWTVSVAR